jgi:hypothetical protein
MKKLTSLLIFVGLAFNVSGQDQPKNLKEVLQADWLIGTWETKNADGQVSSHTFSWKIEDVLMVKEYRVNGELQSFAIISLDVDEDKVISHSYANRRTAPTPILRPRIGFFKVEPAMSLLRVVMALRPPVPDAVAQCSPSPQGRPVRAEGSNVAT